MKPMKNKLLFSIFYFPFICFFNISCSGGVIDCGGSACENLSDSGYEQENLNEIKVENLAQEDENADWDSEVSEISFDVSVDESPIEEPEPPPPIYSFVVFGDNQFATTSCTSGVPERMAIPEAIIDIEPTFILHTGDLMDHGYEDGAYDAFFHCYEGMLSTFAFFPTPGNHDMGSGGILNYKSYLEEQLFNRNPDVYGSTYGDDFEIYYEDDPTDYCSSPSNPCMRDKVPSGFTYKTFYAYKFANAYFISFEQGTRWWTNTPMPWVESHLQSARMDPEIKHIFVHMHHPMYSTTMAEHSTDGECIDFVREHYEEIFRRYDVTIVFSGHAHVYDRFYVPDDGSPTRARPAPQIYPHDGSGIHYIVTGGGGGPLPSPCPPSERHELSYDYSQNRGCGYHFTLVEVVGDEINVSIIGVDGNSSNYTTEVWDTFSIKP